MQLADLVGVAFHDDVPERYLAVAADGDASLVPYRQNRGCMDRIHVHSRLWRTDLIFLACVGTCTPHRTAVPVDLVPFRPACSL